MDAIPVFSQTKSLVQAVCGQKDEARQTQINFSRQCPVVSQIRSIVELSKGDKDSAKETQKQCGNFALSLLNSVPVVGHVKGSIHYACGDKQGGDLAMKAASHSSLVIAGGVGGFVVGGPVGATAGGIAMGTSCDATISLIDSKCNKTFTPYGILEPLGDPRNAGKWCDAVATVALDGIAGRASGKVTKIVLENASMKNNLAVTNPVIAAIMEEPSIVSRPIGSAGITGSIIFCTKNIMYHLNNGTLKKYYEMGNKCYEEYKTNPAFNWKSTTDGQKGDIEMGDLTANYTGGKVEVRRVKRHILPIGLGDCIDGKVESRHHNIPIIYVENGLFYYVDNSGVPKQIEEKVAYSFTSEGLVKVSDPEIAKIMPVKLEEDVQIWHDAVELDEDVQLCDDDIMLGHNEEEIQPFQRWGDDEIDQYRYENVPGNMNVN